MPKRVLDKLRHTDCVGLFLRGLGASVALASCHSATLEGHASFTGALLLTCEQLDVSFPVLSSDQWFPHMIFPSLCPCFCKNTKGLVQWHLSPDVPVLRGKKGFAPSRIRWMWYLVLLPRWPVQLEPRWCLLKDIRIFLFNDSTLFLLVLKGLPPPPASLNLVHLLLWFLIFTRVRAFLFTRIRMGLGPGNQKWLDPHGNLQTPWFQLNGHPGDCQDRSWRENWSNYLDHSGRRISEAFFFSLEQSR